MKKSKKLSRLASGVSHLMVPTFVQESATSVCGRFRLDAVIHFRSYSVKKLRRNEYVST
jgi:hypothetical protein